MFLEEELSDMILDDNYSANKFERASMIANVPYG